MKTHLLGLLSALVVSGVSAARAVDCVDDQCPRASSDGSTDVSSLEGLVGRYSKGAFHSRSLGLSGPVNGVFRRTGTNLNVSLSFGEGLAGLLPQSLLFDVPLGDGTFPYSVSVGGTPLGDVDVTFEGDRAFTMTTGKLPESIGLPVGRLELSATYSGEQVDGAVTFLDAADARFATATFFLGR